MILMATINFTHESIVEVLLLIDSRYFLLPAPSKANSMAFKAELVVLIDLMEGGKSKDGKMNVSVVERDFLLRHFSLTLKAEIMTQNFILEGVWRLGRVSYRK